MNPFKELYAFVGRTVIGLTIAAAWLVVTGNAELKIIGKNGRVIYDNTEKFNAKNN